MHGLGIVFHIIDSIEEVGRQNKLRRVSTVTLELGEVSGVVHTYLEDCWHWAAAVSSTPRKPSVTVSRTTVMSGISMSTHVRRPHAFRSALF